MSSLTFTRARRITDRFRSLRTLVIGDLMLDHFIWGSVSRISPEAPVPVVEVRRETELPGGAGNVAANMAALGAETHLVGIVGEDAAAERLLSLLKASGIRTDGFCAVPERPTIVKTRIIAQQQQVVRFDREKAAALPHAQEKRLRQLILERLPGMAGVVISDYAKGVVSPALVREVVARARQAGISVFVDPKVENFRFYRHVDCVTPNTKEAVGAAGVRRSVAPPDIERLGWTLQRRLASRSVLITRGEQGMSLFEKGRPAYHIPTRAKEVFDVTGAGDTVISVMALATAAGAPLRTAAELANYAAGVVVGKLGTATVSVDELLKALP